MQETPVVTVFLRDGTDVLLLRRSDAVGSYQGRWGAVAGHAEGDPDAAAREEIAEETGIDPDADTTLVRRGESFPVEDPDLDTRWVVTPYLFDSQTTAVEPNEETSEYAWVAPTEILRRETVPRLWTSYDRVRPRVETVAGDTEHGSTALSVRALEILRDEAALAVEGRGERASWDDLIAHARELVDVRPSMPVIATRIDRAVDQATWARTPEALETAAADGTERALGVDDEAATAAAAWLDAERIATLSRSGTVTATLERAEPEAVLVAESRPGGEGRAAASVLADRLDATEVTLTTDAGLAAQLAEWGAEALLVGADAVFADGRVRNKVGTRGAAIVGAHEGIDVVVVTASDKIVPDEEIPDEPRPASELTDEDDVVVANPTFDVTPPAFMDAIVTERGVLDAAAVTDIAAEHREFRGWRA